jgi:hypothetical protein
VGYPDHVSSIDTAAKFQLTSTRYFIGYGCSYIGDDNSTASFRTAWGIQFVPCVFFMIGLPFLPESPRWLAKVDRTEEALHILANIQAGGDLENPYVVAEYEEIITVLTAERLAPKSWRKFVYNGMWRRTLAGFSVQAWQQLSGANVMTYYIVYIFCKINLLVFVGFFWLILDLRYGQPIRRSQPDCVWSTVRSIHYLFINYVLLRR